MDFIRVAANFSTYLFLGVNNSKDDLFLVIEAGNSPAFLGMCKSWKQAANDNGADYAIVTRSSTSVKEPSR